MVMTLRVCVWKRLYMIPIALLDAYVTAGSERLFSRVVCHFDWSTGFSLGLSGIWEFDKRYMHQRGEYELWMIHLNTTS